MPFVFILNDLIFNHREIDFSTFVTHSHCMLKTLVIDNLALIEHAEFEFQTGLICFTGETGAGKSVFLSALRLLAGQRCDRMALRPGSTMGKLEGLFSFTGQIQENIDHFLETNDLPTCEDGNLIIRRSFGEKQKVSINGSLATLNTLKELGKFWLEFHTPTEPQRLFLIDVQMALLDRYSGLLKDRSNYTEAYRHWVQQVQQLKTLKSQVQLPAETVDYIKNQLIEFSKLELTSEAIEQLERDFKLISQKETCLQHLQKAHVLFNEANGLNEQLDRLQRELSVLCEQTSIGAPWLEQLQRARIDLQDIEAACEQEQNSFDIDPLRCEQIQQAMQVWLELQRRYGNSLAQVIAARDSMQAQIDGIISGDEKIQELQNLCHKSELLCRDLATQLHNARLIQLPHLTESIIACLKTLGFRNPKFEIALNPKDTLDIYGSSSICFKFASDASLPCLPLDKVASSGELSRMLLAIKSVFHDVQSVPVLVFDEIDANVGGEIGQKVGQLLKNLGKTSQVFCVTHLPQVASQSTTHFCVSKMDNAHLPTICFNLLSDTASRCHEIARMLGDPSSTSAIQHAKSLLQIEY